MEGNFSEELKEILEWVVSKKDFEMLDDFIRTHSRRIDTRDGYIERGPTRVSSYDTREKVEKEIENIDRMEEWAREDFEEILKSVEYALSEEGKVKIKEFCEKNQRLADEKTKEYRQILEQKLKEFEQVDNKEKENEEEKMIDSNEKEEKSVEDEKEMDEEINKGNKPQHLSKGLKKALTQREQDTIEDLFRISDMIESFWANSVCTPEQRESIAKKETDMLAFVKAISELSRNPGYTMEKKKKLVREQLDLYKDIKEDLRKEMDEVAKLMQEKAKEASVELQEKYVTVEANLEKMVNGGIEVEEAKEEAARKKAEKAKKRQEELAAKGKGAEKETQMVEYKGTGFKAKFREIREAAEKETGKKPGRIKSFFETIKALHSEKKADLEGPEIEAIKKQIEENNREYAVEVENEKKALEDVKKAQENEKKLREQGKELKKNLKTAYVEASEKKMEEKKKKLEESKKPIPEKDITEERVEEVEKNVMSFRERRDEKKAKKLANQIDKYTERITSASNELKGLTEKRDTAGVSSVEKEAMEYDRKTVEKYQKKRYEAAKKLERYSGQDR